MNKKWLKIFLPIVVLIFCILVAFWFVKNPKIAQKTDKDPVIAGVPVDVEHITPVDHTILIHSTGEVVPAKKITLRSRISGTVINIADDFSEGNEFSKGDVLLQLDGEDYELQLATREAIYQQASAEFQMEEGRQKIAEKELDLTDATLKNKISKGQALVLRQPQLKKAESELKKADIAVRSAKLNLSRTKIKAPFDGIVTTKSVFEGDNIGSQNALATLVSTDEYWVRLYLPRSKLKWLHDEYALSGASKAEIILPDNTRRAGHIKRIIGVIEPNSSLVQTLVTVSDPLLRDSNDEGSSSPLLLGDYLPVVLYGDKLKQIAKIPLGWVHGEHVWLVDGEKLSIKPVSIIWKDQQYAYINQGLKKGDMVITSDIKVPFNGMLVDVISEQGQDRNQ